MVDIIDLYLLEHSKEHKTPIFLFDTVETNNLVVVLGSPGSGKTSILKKYADTHEKSQFLKIKKFIKLDNQVNIDTKVLLLDGLDEYRSVTTDKTFVIEELANKLKALNDIKIIISCREMDWYGESDKNSLKDVLDSDAVVFSVQSLNPEQQMKMAGIYSIDNPQSFIDKFSPYGFLDNPQMFKMIAELYKEKSELNFSSKAELYETFIRGAKEKNEENKQNLHQLTSDEILKYSGYLAFFDMFTDVESFEDDFINHICDNDKNFSKEKLTKVLNTSLFDHKIFLHRTIAEFTLAHFLVNAKIKREDSLNNERIKALFVKNEKIPTEVRGVYAWLCSLYGDMSFVDVDPYYQAVYGDNSLFTEKQKKEIVLSVKKYAKKHPYFIDFWGIRNQLDGLALLYTHSLDDFYIEQLEEAKSMKNHYIFFIVSILNTSNTLSIKMKEYLKEKVFDSDVPAHIKDDILKVFDEELNFLLDVLSGIKDGSIEDNKNMIKEFLLKRLYPNIVKPNNIVDYLALYKTTEHIIMGHGSYLFKTQYKDKFELARLLLKLRQEDSIKRDKNEHKFYRSNFMDSFISDFLYETILKYPKEMNADEIYKIITKLKYYVDEYEHLEFKPYTLIRKDDSKEHEHQFRQLSNELYSIHIDHALQISSNDEKIIWNAIFNYRYFFPYQVTKTFNIILSKIKPECDIEINKRLFSEALTYIPFGYSEDYETYADEIEQLKEISSKYGFNELLDFRLSKKLPEWEIKRKERDEKEESKRIKIVIKNEEYFLKRTNKEVLTTFGDLKYISDLLYIGKKEEKEDAKYLTKETFERLKQILKELIFTIPFNPKLTTLESLSRSTKGSDRYIDQVYYTSVALNKIDNEKFKKINSDILDYLYINDLYHSNTGNIIKSIFSNYIENNQVEKVLEILKKYIQLLISEHDKNLDFLFDKYISKDSTVERLKRIAMAREWNEHSIQDDLLKNILKGYAFDITTEKIERIDVTLNENSSNKIIIDALVVLSKNKKEKFTREMAVAIFDLFDYTRLFEDTLSEKKVHILDYMFSVFNTEQSIQNVSGFQSQQSQCASFLIDIVKTLSIDELKSLYLLHKNEDNIWRNRILNEIDTKQQQDADQNFDKYSISKIKEFVFSDAILSKDDFFEDIGIKLNIVKQEIEDNRNNEKNQFYNDNGSSKNEESCRDVILQKLNDKYGYDIESCKEKYEADNRVDINIKYKAKPSYEVQVECKKDRNRDLYKGIEHQLIAKYFSSGVEYGIYMIFYFGDKTNKQDMLDKINKSIPDSYEKKIKVIYLELVK